MPRVAQTLQLDCRNRKDVLLSSPGKMPPDNSRPLSIPDPASPVSRTPATPSRILFPANHRQPSNSSAVVRSSGTFESARVTNSCAATAAKRNFDGNRVGIGQKTSPSSFYNQKAAPGSLAEAAQSVQRGSKWRQGVSPSPGGDGDWLGKGGESSYGDWPGTWSNKKKPKEGLNRALAYAEDKGKKLDDLINSTGKDGRRRNEGKVGRDRGQYNNQYSYQRQGNRFSKYTDKTPAASAVFDFPSDYDDLNSNCTPSSSSGIGTTSKTKEPVIDVSPKLSPISYRREPIKPHLMGFQNLGNTCYMLAPLQSLLGLPRLVISCINLETMLVSRQREQEELPLLLLPFTQLCRARDEGDEKRANQLVQELKRHVEKVDPHFKGSMMQDANELLCVFIDQLKESVVKLYPTLGNPVVGAKETPGNPVVESPGNRVVGVKESPGNPVVENFQYERVEAIRCLGCGKQSSSRQWDVNVYCDVSTGENNLPPISLQTLLEQTMGAEERERRCETCGHEQASVSSQLVSLPRVLVLSLKRYRYTQESQLHSEKVSRCVHIPSHLSLHPLVSPSCTSPSPSLPPRIPSQSSPPPPPISSSSTTPAPSAPGTPAKFKGKTDAEVAQLSEEEQMEYMLYRSQTEMGKDHEIGTEEAELEAAIQASISMQESIQNSPDLLMNTTLRDINQMEPLACSSGSSSSDVISETTKQSQCIGDKENIENIEELLNSPTQTMDSPTQSAQTMKSPIQHVKPTEFRTPRKRSYSDQSGNSAKIQRQDTTKQVSGASIQGRESLTPERGLPSPNLGNGTPTLGNGTPTHPRPPTPLPTTPAVSNTVPSIRRPLTRMEEEEDLRKALELSTQEGVDGGEGSTQSSPSSQTLLDTIHAADSENNSDTTEEKDPCPAPSGPPTHHYRLQSVVSHYGASSNSGHYVADVFRFDGGGWWRYDDTSVTATSLDRVRSGRSRTNGYIFMYVHQPQWDACQAAFPTP